MNLGEHPLCDDLINWLNTTCAMYPIDIVFCTNCFTAFQIMTLRRSFFPKTHYRALTGSVLSGMKDLVANIEERLGDLKGKLVLDSGCNDGSLLNFFEEKASKTIGIEPTAAANDSKHETINKFFDAASATYFLERHGYPDVITFTNVFAHINNLPELLENLKIILGEETTLVIENHYLGSVLILISSIPSIMNILELAHKDHLNSLLKLLAKLYLMFSMCLPWRQYKSLHRIKS